MGQEIIRVIYSCTVLIGLSVAWGCFAAAREAPDSRGHAWRFLGVLIAVASLNAAARNLIPGWKYCGDVIEAVMLFAVVLAIGLVSRTFVRQRFKQDFTGLKQTHF
jgi:hypothetical protein